MPGFKAYGQGEQFEADPANAKNSFWGAALVEAVKNGSVPEARYVHAASSPAAIRNSRSSRLDDMVIRTYAAFYKLGQDHGYPDLNMGVKYASDIVLSTSFSDASSAAFNPIMPKSFVKSELPAMSFSRM